MSQNDRRFNKEIELLRSERRLNLLEVPRVVQYSLEGITANSVLDVGTGSGIFAEAFASKNLTVMGIDIREDMLDAARQFVPTGKFKLGKMEAIPYPNQCVDLVFLGHVLHEADDVSIALSESYRVGIKRTAVLEWAYRQEDFGPPLHHRLKPEDVFAMAKDVGFKAIGRMDLNHLVLYLFDA